MRKRKEFTSEFKRETVRLPRSQWHAHNQFWFNRLGVYPLTGAGVMHEVLQSSHADGESDRKAV